LLINLLLPSLSTAAVQSFHSKLAQPVSRFDSENSSTADQLIEFAQQFHIPMGIEWVEMAVESSAKPVHARNSTARAVLEQIVKQRQGMGFSGSDGVVHVFDQSFINDSRNFLNVHIPHFRVENETLFGAEFWLKIDIERVLTPVAGGFAGGHGYGIPGAILLINATSTYPLMMQPFANYSIGLLRSRVMHFGWFEFCRRK
jgi:hypothetical protein